MKPEDVLFIVGPQSLYTNLIERFIREAGCRVARADFRPALEIPDAVHATIWQHAEKCPVLPDKVKVIVLVEVVDYPYGELVVKDRDYGAEVIEVEPVYSNNPHNFLTRSSLGRVLSLLAGWGFRVLETSPLVTESFLRATVRGDIFWSYEWGWLLDTANGFKQVPEDLLFRAAEQYSLLAAYHGDCPGIWVEDVASRRILSQFVHADRSIESVSLSMYQAEQVLRNPEYCNKCTGIRHPGTDRALDGVLGCQHEWAGRVLPCKAYPGYIVDLRGHDIPEAVEAAYKTGIPILLHQGDTHVLHAATPGIVEEFLSGSIVKVEDPIKGREPGSAMAKIPHR